MAGNMGLESVGVSRRWAWWIGIAAGLALLACGPGDGANEADAGEGLFDLEGEALELVYLAQVSEESPERGVRLLARGRSGGQAVLPIPEGASFIGSGRSVLAAWADLEGTRIQFYTLDLERAAAEPFLAEPTAPPPSP